MFRLPDIPNVGYSTTRQKTGSDQIMFFMREVERERLRLLTIVCDGREKWRRIGRQVFGTTMEIDDAALDAIYDYFTLQAAKPANQRALLNAQHNPAKWRDVVREIMPDIEAQREGLKLLKKWAP